MKCRKAGSYVTAPHGVHHASWPGCSPRKESVTAVPCDPSCLGANRLSVAQLRSTQVTQQRYIIIGAPTQ